MFSLRAAEALAAFLLLDSDGLDDIVVDELDQLHSKMKKEEIEKYMGRLAPKPKIETKRHKPAESSKESPIKKRCLASESLQKQVSTKLIDNFKIDLGLSATQIEKIISMIGPVFKKSYIEKNIKTFVMIGLSSLTTTIPHSDLGENFSKSKHMICLHSQHFNKLIIDNFIDNIKWPLNKENNIIKGFEQICGFPNVVGAFGTCFLPFNYSNDSLNVEEGESSPLILSATSDPSMKFTSLSIDTLLNFQSTNGMSSQTIQTLLRGPQNLIEKDKDMHILAGPGFPLCANILTPYLGFDLSNEQELFNSNLEATRKPVFKAFAYLRQRFQRLASMDVTNFKHSSSAVIAACILHNILIDGEEIEELSTNIVIPYRDVLDYDAFEEEYSSKRDQIAKRFTAEVCKLPLEFENSSND